MKTAPDLFIQVPKPRPDDPITGPGATLGFNLVARTIDNNFDLIFQQQCYDNQFRIDRVYYMSKEGLLDLANHIIARIKTEEIKTETMVKEKK